MALREELQQRLGVEYAEAFAARSPARVVAFYKPNAVVVFHESAREIKAFTGGVFGALRRGAIPERMMFKIFFRRMAKKSYDHSTIDIVGVHADGEVAAKVRIKFDRVDTAGKIIESGVSVYALEKIGGAWFISEAWVYDPANAPSAP